MIRHAYASACIAQCFSTFAYTMLQHQSAVLQHVLFLIVSACAQHVYYETVLFLQIQHTLNTLYLQYCG
jgi:hypothetical protein